MSDRKGSNMLTRVISGVAVAVIMLGIVWFGGAVTAVGLALISCIAYSEMISATGVRMDQAKGPCIFEVVGTGVIIIYYAMIFFEVSTTYLMLMVVLYVVVLMLIFVFTFPSYRASQVMRSYFSFVYAPVMLSFVLMTRQLSVSQGEGIYNVGFFSVWMTFISAWGSDTCAYFTGVLFGKHKITPRLSPKKSVEGCIGGVVGAGLLGLVYGVVLHNLGRLPEGDLWAYPLLGICGSVVGQIGDLAASAIKRNFGIKDYGNIIPGHGGVMDRFDSVIFTAPLIYLLTLIVLGK